MGLALRRRLHTLGLVLMIFGVVVVAWGLLAWRWQEPFTALYTMYEQHKLSDAYDKRARHLRASIARRLPPAVQPERPTVAEEERAVGRQARLYRLGSHTGDPLGRIVVKRLGLKIVVVNGTDHTSLQRGPGRELHTAMPGEGRLVYIAGHRTTYLAPFSHIDALRTGDRITLEFPYATFVYSVTRHVIVPSDDLSVLRPGSHEVLALQACHPRFFATHRYIVYALPVKVIPAAALGPPYQPDRRRSLA